MDTTGTGYDRDASEECILIAVDEPMRRETKIRMKNINRHKHNRNRSGFKKSQYEDAKRRGHIGQRRRKRSV